MIVWNCGRCGRKHTERDDCMTDRDKEKLRYDEVYKDPHYRMGFGRIEWAVDKLRDYAQPPFGALNQTHLDVGTGRGELVVAAYALGFKSWGVEAAPSLAWSGGDRCKVIIADAWNLPFGDGIWDVVTCMDMLEHILEDDVLAVLKELFRVSRHRVLLTASNIDSTYEVHGQLHVTRLDYQVWDALIHQAALGDKRNWMIMRTGKVGVAEGWDCQAV